MSDDFSEPTFIPNICFKTAGQAGNHVCSEHIPSARREKLHSSEIRLRKLLQNKRECL